MNRPSTDSLFIGGKWLPSRSGRTFAVINPATGARLADVADAGSEDGHAAVDAAHAALKSWARTPAARRGHVLRQAAALMRERRESLGRQLTQEMGKPLTEAIGEIAYAASHLEWFAGEGERAYGEIVPPATPDKRHFVLKQPVGIVLAITPWNFPAAMMTRKVAPALAAGCTVILKPAEQTPLTAISVLEILAEAGLPPGVVNMLTVDQPGPLVAGLIDDPRVRKITFTGSTPVGKQLMRAASDQVKRISLELGGHAPVIVFNDANVDKAVAGTMASKFRNMGQTCICANRIYVQSGVFDKFAERFAAATAALRVGNGLNSDVQVGPLVNRAGLHKVQRHVEDAVAAGATVLTGGTALTEGEFSDGAYFAPTVLKDVRPGMLIMEEETFGPVAPLIRFETEAEAYEQANDTRYGLAAYVFTESLNRALRAAEGLEYGIVAINDGAPSTANVPFGGVKESGIGREGGAYGIDEFLEVKLVGLSIDEEPD